MARMYSRKKGKAGSNKPVDKSKPLWVRYKANEIELLATKLAKDGMVPSQIGMTLRDAYGIPSVKLIAGKKISKVLTERKAQAAIPEDLMALIKRTILLKKHLETNKHDVPAKRGLELTDSKIRRNIKYYKKSGKLAQDWTYDPEKIRIMIE